jgi:hypothetical protein
VGRPAVVAQGAAFLPGGARVVISGHTPSAGGRLFTYDLSTSALSPISPEGVTSYFNAMVSPDGSGLSRRGPTVTCPVDGRARRAGKSGTTSASADGDGTLDILGVRHPRRAVAVATGDGSRGSSRPDPPAQSIGRPHERGREGLVYSTAASSTSCRRRPA